MAYVRRGNDIRNIQDVQNLITAVILRQRNCYTKDYLLRAVAYYMPSDKAVADAIASEETISSMIDDTLDILHRNNHVVRLDGIYHNVSNYAFS